MSNQFSNSRKNTGPGKYFVKVEPVPGVVRLWIYNFDVASAALKDEHRGVLSSYIVPLISSGGGVKLLGIASTTGSDAMNKKLSEDRCESVAVFLRAQAGNTFNISKQIGMGESIAKAFKAANMKGGTADNVESEIWRGVVLNVWNRSMPPPPSVPGDSPFQGQDLGPNSWVSTASNVLDIANMGVSIVNMIADFASLAALAAITDIAGLALGGIGAIVGLPLMWANIDDLARANGRIQGAADAVQDLCDQFSAESLRRSPYSQWPKIKVPEPHTSDNPQPTQAQLAWREGQREGLKIVLDKILKMEQNPADVTTPDGKHIRLSGRLWLAAMSQKHKDQCGFKIIIEPANEELRKNNRPPWPTR